MKKLYYLILALSLVVFGCSKDNSDLNDSPVIKVRTLTKVTPEKAKIGDTITIEGENLDKISLQFNDTRFIRTISVQSNKIVAIVPTLYNENVTIKSLTSDNYVNDSIKFNLVGFFPIHHSLPYDDIQNIKAVSEKTFFATIGSKLYKTTDGGYQWNLMQNFSSIISAIYFLNEQTGWVNVGGSDNSLFFTNDYGKSFQQLFSSGPAYSGKSIMDMCFSSANTGYVLTGKGDIFTTNDNSKFNLSYTYPESNKESGYIEFTCLSTYNNTVMAIGQSGPDGHVPVLIKAHNNIFSSSTFSEPVWKVQVLNDQEAYLVVGNKLYYSNNCGETWAKVSDMRLYNIYFIDKNNGFGISSDPDYGHHIILKTTNGGISWQQGLNLMDFEYTTGIAHKGNVTLFAGYRGRLWKYIKE